eukprot:g584.t1
MSTTFSSFGVTVAWDLTVFAGCLFAFNILRKLEQTKKVYAPKRFIPCEKYSKPKALPKGHLFDWIRPLFQYTEEDIIKIAGFDAAVYLKIFSFGIRLFTVASIFILLVVLPVNLTGNRVDTLQRISSGELTDEEITVLQAADATLTNDTHIVVRDTHDAEEVDYVIGSFDKLSMTNVKPQSMRLWAHLVAIWFMSIFTLKLLWQYHAEAVKLRIQFLATTENGAQSHTVLVRDIPGLRFGSPLDRLMRSSLFKFLPLKIRQRVENSIELLFSVATEGVDRMSILSVQLAKNVADQFTQTDNRPKLKMLKNKRGLRWNDGHKNESFHLSSCSSIHQQIPIYIKAEDITDMDPVDWVTAKLKIGIPLEKVVDLQFREVYPDGLVECSNLVYDTTPLERLLTEYDKVFIKLEDLVDHYRQNINKGCIMIDRKKKRVVPVLEGKWAVERFGNKPFEADLMMFYIEKLQSLRIRIIDAQHKITDVPVPTAFVTFKTRWAQVIAATSLHHHFQSFWHVQEAPDPEEIVWPNLNLRSWERYLRKFVVWSEFALLCVFFMVPVGFVQGMIQMDRLENTPVLGAIVTFPLVNGVLKGVVPTLVLKLFLAFLPKILTRMNHWQGLISLSEIDFEVVRKYFIFQTITVFFGSFLTGTLFGQMQELRNDPNGIIDILGVAAPQTATFFITYILYTGLIEGGVAFLNLTNLIKLWLLTRFAGTERAKARVWSNQTIEYGDLVPSHTFIILLGLAFSVVNPIVLPVTLLYFIAMKITWTYNMVYIYSEEYQSGGRLWEYVFEQVLVGLVVMQLMTIFLMAIKKFPYLALLAPLPIITLLFRLLAHRMYDRPLKILSLRAAHDLDVANQVKTEVKVDDKQSLPVDDDHETHFEVQEIEESSQLPSASSSSIDCVRDKYKHPSFLIDWGELEELLDDAKNLDYVIKGLTERLTKTGYLSYNDAKRNNSASYRNSVF